MSEEEDKKLIQDITRMPKERQPVGEDEQRVAADIQVQHHGLANPVFADPHEANEAARKAANEARSAEARGETPPYQMSEQEMQEITARIRAELARDKSHPLRALGTVPPDSTSFAKKEAAKKKEGEQSQGEGRG